MNEARKLYWENKILPWERARYSALAALNPFAWSIRLRRRKAASMILETLPCPQIIELGCGSGTLAACLNYSTYAGYDFSESAIERARQRKLPRATFAVLDVCSELQDVHQAEFTVMLGLTDWLEPQELARLFSFLKTDYILFSYTQQKMRRGLGLFLYRIYRTLYDKNKISPRQYEASIFQGILEPLGYTQVRAESSSIFPGVLLLWKKQKA